MLKWSHNSTLYCTLSHYSAPFCLPRPAQRPLHADQRSVNHTFAHLLIKFHCIYAHTQTIAAGPKSKSALHETAYVYIHYVALNNNLCVYSSLSSVKIQFHTVYVIFFYAPCGQYHSAFCVHTLFKL